MDRCNKGEKKTEELYDSGLPREHVIEMYLYIGNQSTKVEHDALLGDINQFTSSADENQ